MDPEKRAFLEKVMSEMVENEGKSMKDLVEVGTPAPAPCSRARLAREAGGWDLVKLEVLGDQKTLYPDMPETLRAA